MSRRHKLPLFDADLEAKAKAFHEANGHVYEKLRALAFEAKNAGSDRIGIAALVEQLRWSGLKTTGSKYTFDNSFRSFYARLLMANEPELDGMFVIRDAAFDTTYRDRKERQAS